MPLRLLSAVIVFGILLSCEQNSEEAEGSSDGLSANCPVSLSCGIDRVDALRSTDNLSSGVTEQEPLPNQRFGKSEIKDPVFDTSLVFGIWTLSHNDPACDFRIDKQFYAICDYDGDGERLYKIERDSIFLDNPSLIFKGKIIRATGDTLCIHWQNNKKPKIYLRWKE